MSDTNEERVRVPGIIHMGDTGDQVPGGDHSGQCDQTRLTTPLKIAVDNVMVDTFTTGSRLKQKPAWVSPLSKFSSR